MVRAVLDQIDRHNSVVNAFCWVDRDAALRGASDSEARWMAGAPRGLIDGVPVGVKDNVLVAGMPARFGSKLTSDAPVAHDAPAVARLHEQGAIIIGKTSMPEFGWKAVTDSPLTGVTRNPWDTRKTPGGSSGGAVAAVVLGMGNIHLGTDGGGSIRIPAAFAGSYGIKPTRARVPAWPASPLGTLAHVGCLTRSVADAAHDRGDGVGFVRPVDAGDAQADRAGRHGSPVERGLHHLMQDLFDRQLARRVQVRARPAALRQDEPALVGEQAHRLCAPGVNAQDMHPS